MLAKEKLLKYIDKPPSCCYYCYFSTHISDGSNNNPTGNQIYCIFDRGSAKKLKRSNNKGCGSEVFTKKLLELI